MFAESVDQKVHRERGERYVVWRGAKEKRGEVKSAKERCWQACVWEGRVWQGWTAKQGCVYCRMRVMTRYGTSSKAEEDSKSNAIEQKIEGREERR